MTNTAVQSNKQTSTFRRMIQFKPIAILSYDFWLTILSLLPPIAGHSFLRLLQPRKVGKINLVQHEVDPQPQGCQMMLRLLVFEDWKLKKMLLINVEHVIDARFCLQNLFVLVSPIKGHPHLRVPNFNQDPTYFEN